LWKADDDGQRWEGTSAIRLDFLDEHFDSPAHQLRRQHNWKRCGKSKENRREAYEMAVAKLFAHAGDERKLTHGGCVASIKIYADNTALVPEETLPWLETANPEEFSHRQKKKRPEDFEFLKLKLDGSVDALR